ncbi:MAG: hypothetical protein L3J79_12655 [Candidatus Marinimicrobia bacterium]|nr:hypothetical protein [Candidatus Neomarinimicrobiota bacterium]
MDTQLSLGKDLGYISIEVFKQLRAELEEVMGLCHIEWKIDPIKAPSPF